MDVRGTGYSLGQQGHGGAQCLNSLHLCNTSAGTLGKEDLECQLKRDLMSKLQGSWLWWYSGGAEAGGQWVRGQLEIHSQLVSIREC